MIRFPQFQFDKSDPITQGRKRRRTKKLLTTVSTLLLLATVWSAMLYFFQKPVVVLSSETRFAVGEKVSLSDLVPEVKRGKLLSEDYTIESQTPGTRQITILLENRLGVQRQEKFIISFYDDKPPILTHPESLVVLKGSSPDLTEGVSSLDENGVPCHISVSGDYDFNTPGEYTVIFTSSDGSGNTATGSMTLKVLALPFDESGKTVDGEYTTLKGFKLVVKNGVSYIDGHLLVNKSYPLPKTFSSQVLQTEAAAALNKMQKDAAAEGFPLSVKNTYRSWSDQDHLFRGEVKEAGFEAVQEETARAGHSEHQTGLALDLAAVSSLDAQRAEVAKTLTWLKENAYRYGFILRYPEGKSEETGFAFKPWHYRYVGTELAKILYDNGDFITMEAYFGLDSIYRGY